MAPLPRSKRRAVLPPKQCSVESNLALSSVCRISAAAAIALVAIALAVTPSDSPAATKVIPVDFGWSPTAPTPGQVVSFTAAATPSDGVSIKSYDWDLNGDGSIDKHGATATWSYPGPGPVIVRLSVTGNGNRRGEAAHTVSVQAAGGGGGGVVPIPPVASFTIAPAAPVVNQPVLFTSTSRDPDGTLVEQVWDLNGDGNYDNGGGAAALRAFADAGTYAVGLRVTDNAGLVSFDSQTLTVAPAPGTPVGVTTLKSGLRVLSPFPVVRIAGRITKRGTRVRLLRVKAPLGTTVTVRCTGRSCPFKKQVRTVPTSTSSRTAVNVRVRRLERLLLPGVRVRVYVTTRGAVGKYARFRFRARKPPARTDSCVMPGSWAPAECPAL
jgi:PKD repeat protein